MKKWMSILLVICVMAVLFTSAVMATQGTQIVVDSKYAQAGEEIVLNVSIVNNPGFTNGKINVIFDETVMEIVEIDTYTGLLMRTLCMSNGAAMNFVSVMDIQGDGILFSVKLKVKDGAAKGDYPVGVEVEYIQNSASENLAPEVKAGNVHVCPMTAVAEKAADCTNTGMKAHAKCECGKLYANGAEVVAENLVIPALGHKMGEPDLVWENGVCKSVCKCVVCDAVLGEVKLEVKEALTDEDVPEQLQETPFDTIVKIEEELQVQIQEELKTQLENAGESGDVQLEPEEIYLYDVVLIYQNPDGNVQEADKDHFPEDGKLQVTLAVPAGTSPETHKYHVAHMFTTDAFGKKPGDVEIFTDLVAQPDGNGGYCITFEVTGLSPIMVCAEEIYDPCAEGHSFGEWYVTVPSTGTEKGEARRDCENCDHFETRAQNLLGDVNGDGKVNTVDAKLVMRYELKLIDETQLDLSVADINGDGKYNTADAKQIMQFELKLVSNLGVDKAS